MITIIIVEKKRAKKGSKYKNSGTLVVQQSSLRTEVSFLDYIRGGCNLSLCVAVDFTASNGDPHLRHSLHRLDRETPNQVRLNRCHGAGMGMGDGDGDEDGDGDGDADGDGHGHGDGTHMNALYLMQYEIALKGVCDIVLPYDSDQMVN